MIGSSLTEGEVSSAILMRLYLEPRGLVLLTPIPSSEVG